MTLNILCDESTSTLVPLALSVVNIFITSNDIDVGYRIAQYSIHCINVLP